MANDGWGIAQVHSTVAFEMHDSTVINLQAVLLCTTNLSFRPMSKAFCYQHVVVLASTGRSQIKTTFVVETIIYIYNDVRHGGMKKRSTSLTFTFYS